MDARKNLEERMVNKYKIEKNPMMVRMANSGITTLT